MTAMYYVCTDDYILWIEYDMMCSGGLEYWFYGVVVSTADFESADPGSNPGRTLFFQQLRLFAR